MRLRHRRAHRRIWLGLALVLPLLFLAALLFRPSFPRGEAPVRLSAPP